MNEYCIGILVLIQCFFIAVVTKQILSLTSLHTSLLKEQDEVKAVREELGQIYDEMTARNIQISEYETELQELITGVKSGRATITIDRVSEEDMTEELNSEIRDSYQETILDWARDQIEDTQNDNDD